MAKKFLTPDALEKFLESHSIPVSEWGTGAAKSIEELYESYCQREIHILEAEASSKFCAVAFPILWCRKVKIDIFCDGDEDGQLRYLIEGEQKLTNGNVRGRSWRRSVSEKLNHRESADAAARRAMEEELGLSFAPETVPAFWTYEEYVARPRPSNSFPGMLMTGPRTKLVTVLHPSLYEPLGYDEYKDGVPRTHFSWYLASEVWGTGSTA